MKAQEFLDKLRSIGRNSFNTQEAQDAFHSSKAATLNALKRLKAKKLIASPARGFYVIVPPEYQILGCLPPSMLTPQLMKHLNLPYYVGFLSAAEYYAAAHQKPQRFQIVTTKNRPPIRCGKVYIKFIANKHTEEMPIRKFNTKTSILNVATPEVLAADIVSAPLHAAGINNVATILIELAESIDITKLQELANINPQHFWLQRLGYLFESLEIKELAKAIEKILHGKKLHWARLVSYSSYTPLERNHKWKIIVNTEVEPDL